MPIRNAASGRGAVAQVRRLLPRGHTLPPEELRRRHHALLALLWLHVLVVPLWGVDRGYSLGHSLLEGGAIAVCAVAAAGMGAIVAWRLNEDLRDRHVGLIAEKQAALERAEAAERELERHARELARSNRELDEFASIASHDLTAPLLTVSGFLTLLAERYGDRLDD